MPLPNTPQQHVLPTHPDPRDPLEHPLPAEDVLKKIRARYPGLVNAWQSFHGDGTHIDALFERLLPGLSKQLTEIARQHIRDPKRLLDETYIIIRQHIPNPPSTLVG